MEDAAQTFDQSLATQFLQGYRITAFIMGIFFLSLVPWRLINVMHRASGSFLAWEAGLLTLACLAFALWGHRIQAHSGHVENLGFLLVAIGVINNFSLLAVEHDPEQAANFMLILVASGLGFQSRWRFLLSQTLVLAFWAIPSCLLLDLNHFLDWAFPVGCAFLIGLAVHLFLNRVLGALKELRARDQIYLHQRAHLIADLRSALENVKTLRGLIPICSQCKKVRNDEGYWQQVESYVGDHSEAEFTHGLCPECTSHLEAEFEEIVPTRPLGEEPKPE